MQVSVDVHVTVSFILGSFLSYSTKICAKTILPPYPYLTPRSGEPRQNFPTAYCCGNTTMMGQQEGSKSFTISLATCENFCEKFRLVL